MRNYTHSSVSKQAQLLLLLYWLEINYTVQMLEMQEEYFVEVDNQLICQLIIKRNELMSKRGLKVKADILFMAVF